MADERPRRKKSAKGAAGSQESPGETRMSEQNEIKSENPGEAEAPDETPGRSESAAPAEEPNGAVKVDGFAPERVLDITLGLGVLAAEAIDRAAVRINDTVRQVQKDAPGFFSEIEEKGRPLRERFASGLRSAVPTVTDVFTAGAGDTPRGAGEDISALENRVRELEQQVGAPAETPEAPSPFAMLELDDAPAGESGGDASEKESPSA